MPDPLPCPAPLLRVPETTTALAQHQVLTPISPEHSDWTLWPLHLWLSKGQAGMGTELALSVNKSTVPCTEWCSRCPAQQGGCAIGKGVSGSLNGWHGWLWRG